MPLVQFDVGFSDNERRMKTQGKEDVPRMAHIDPSCNE